MCIKKTICAGLVAMAIPLGMCFVDSSVADAAKASKQVVASEAAQIDMQAAKEIALNHAGFKEEQVRFKKLQVDHEYGQLVYEIEFKVDNDVYGYEIAASDGEILSYEREID